MIFGSHGRRVVVVVVRVLPGLSDLVSDSSPADPVPNGGLVLAGSGFILVPISWCLR